MMCYVKPVNSFDKVYGDEYKFSTKLIRVIETVNIKLANFLYCFMSGVFVVCIFCCFL